MEELKDNMYESSALLMNQKLDQINRRYNNQSSFIQLGDKKEDISNVYIQDENALNLQNISKAAGFKQKSSKTESGLLKSESKILNTSNQLFYSAPILKTQTLIKTTPVVET